MAKINSVLVVVFAVSTCGVSNGDAPVGRRSAKLIAADYGWMTDYQAALKRARETDKPTMVVFRCVP